MIPWDRISKVQNVGNSEGQDLDSSTNKWQGKPQRINRGHSEAYGNHQEETMARKIEK